MLKREITLHLIIFIGFFSLIVVVKGWFDFSYIVFLLGGLLGLVLPDMDHLVYVYFVNPTDVYSLKFKDAIRRKNYNEALDNLAETKGKELYLIFHTALFQLIFLALGFLVITSSGSIFGRGIVLAFMLHLLLDQYMDFRLFGNIDKWFGKLNLQLAGEKQLWYIGVYAGILLVFSFLL